MPMLALLLLCAGLFGRDTDAGDASLRSQILRTEAPQDTHAALPLQLYHLRQDRVLRLGNRHSVSRDKDHGLCCLENVKGVLR